MPGQASEWANPPEPHPSLSRRAVFYTDHTPPRAPFSNISEGPKFRGFRPSSRCFRLVRFPFGYRERNSRGLSDPHKKTGPGERTEVGRGFDLGEKKDGGPGGRAWGPGTKASPLPT